MVDTLFVQKFDLEFRYAIQRFFESDNCAHPEFVSVDRKFSWHVIAAAKHAAWVSEVASTLELFSYKGHKTEVVIQIPIIIVHDTALSSAVRLG